MVSVSLLRLVRCPECRSDLAERVAENVEPMLTCTACGRSYPKGDGKFLDLRPAVQFSEQTKYLDDALHADARHERVSPPLLGSKIRNDMLRTFLAPQATDRVVDLGCGSGRALLWNRDWKSVAVGVDIAPFFSSDALDSVDLLLADLRKLPFANDTFTKAFSLDVLEHLSPEALRATLAEANRILAPGGTLFVYTHVRKNAPIARALRTINRLAELLDRIGWIDLRQEHLRKSDHVNPLRDIPELEAVALACGFRIARIQYYTPIVGAIVQNILMRMAERALTRRAARRLSAAGVSDVDIAAIREVRTAAKSQIARSPTTLAVLRGLSFAMKLDLVLFGRMRSGPFFALLEKVGSA